MKKWLSNFDKCDVCNQPIKGVEEYFVDGKVRGHSAWALMCPTCYTQYGAGIGPGIGQKYDGKTGELIDGGCEDND